MGEDEGFSTSAAARRGGRVGLKLSLRHRYTLFGISFGVWSTGVVWLFYHYFMQMESEFGLRKHWMEVASLELHGAFSFAAIWVMGTLWWTHVLRGWTLNWRRWSGGFMAGFFLVLTISGWGLYYFVQREWREWTSVIHWSVGLAALVIFLIHWLSKSRAARTR